MRHHTLYFPSDCVQLASLEPPGHVFRLAGRVVAQTDVGVILADAFARIEVAFERLGEFHPGDLLEVVAHRTNSHPGLQVRQVLRHVPCPEPRGDGETMRLGSGRAHTLKMSDDARKCVRRYFESQGFLEVETPTFAPCPGLDPHVFSLAPLRVDGETHHLITSPEFHMKRLLAGGLPRIFQIARCFRSEELGPFHEPEFSLVEWYRAFSDWTTMLDDTEALVRAVFEQIATPERRTALGTDPFLRLTVRDAFQRFAEEHDAVALARENSERYFSLLVERVEPGLTQLGRPVFLTHFPISQAALARPAPEDPTVAERFELYIDGVELCNGFGELTDEKEQRRRFEHELEQRKLRGEPLYPLDERFLAALSEGLPPSAGNALGLERLVALATHTGVASTLAFAHRER